MKTRHLVHALPFCCLFLAAANQQDCTIHVVVDHNGDEGEGEGEGEGQVGEGEGEGQPGDCQSDADCGPGQICELSSACPPCAEPGDPNAPSCDIACTVSGTCVEAPPPPPGCVTDDDCGPGAFCDYANCGPAPDGSGVVACDTGVCEPLPPPPPSCQSDSDCGPNSYCDFSQCGDPTGGNGGSGGSDRPIAPCPGVCLELPPPPPPPDGCQSDADCQVGTHCETVCAVDDPTTNSGTCTSQCVPDADPCLAALCAPGTQCVIQADGTVGCEPAPAECQSDADCGPNQVCNAGDVCLPDPNCPPGADNCTMHCWGTCIDVQPASCNVDSDCPDGQSCLVTTVCPPCNSSDPACEAPCFVEGTCVVRDPPPPQP